MPPITRWFLKASFLYLVIALLLNLLIALAPITGWEMASYNPVFFHLFLVGWVTNMIIGVGTWMFPKKSREQPRGPDSLNWAVFALLNLGLLLRAISEPASGPDASALIKGLLLTSAVSQWVGAMLFVFNAWPRIKER